MLPHGPWGLDNPKFVLAWQRAIARSLRQRSQEAHEIVDLTLCEVERLKDFRAIELFQQAGFREIATTKIAAPFRLPTVQDYMKFIKTSAGPIVQIVQQLEQAKREAAWLDIESALARFATATGWEGPNEILLTAARR